MASLQGETFESPETLVNKTWNTNAMSTALPSSAEITDNKIFKTSKIPSQTAISTTSLRPVAKQKTHHGVTNALEIPRSLTPVHRRHLSTVVFHFVRHALAEHNVTYDFNIPDPKLTFLGHMQCKETVKDFPNLDNITTILCSPLQRTISTALAFRPLYARGLKAILWEDLAEFGNCPSSIGASRAELKTRLGDRPFIHSAQFRDTAALKPESFPGRKARVRRVTAGLYSLANRSINGGTWRGLQIKKQEGEISILVVSHGSFLKDLLDNGNEPWFNGQRKTFRFASEEHIRNGFANQKLVQSQ